jgi:hypothetical protein
MVTVVRWMSACLSPLPNTFFEVLPLLLPMAGGVRSGQLSETGVRIQNPEFRIQNSGANTLANREFPGREDAQYGINACGR